MEHVTHFLREFLRALKSLAPIVAVVVVFQLAVFQQPPHQPLRLAAGLLIVGAGIALFLQGLDLSVFPVGRNLANEFARRGALELLLPFGFAIGFAAVVAEPALIAVAEQAQEVSGGRVESLTLRLVIAVSVGLVLVLGVLRILRGWPVHRLLIPGYAVVLAVTFAAPPEIVGLAYDSGGVTTNIVTVPLVAAIGIGLANSIRGRSVLRDGFGLVALCVMVPMLGVQLYGIWVYTFGEPDRAAGAAAAAQDAPHWALELVLGLAETVREVLPIVVVVLFFQYVALRSRLPRPLRVVVGFAMVVGGLYAFVVGLGLGLFPLGRMMAEQLIDRGAPGLVLLFTLLIGFATTMAEPALMAIGEQAEAAAPGRISATGLRVVVALGVAAGIGVGAYRILGGAPFHWIITAAWAAALALALVAPRDIVALAFDLGGVTTSEVTVPLVTALGIGLASATPGRDVLIDGFGLIAFASVAPVIAVMLYAMIVDRVSRPQKESP